MPPASGLAEGIGSVWGGTRDPLALVGGRDMRLKSAEAPNSNQLG
jgi:hypothetical protein